MTADPALPQPSPLWIGWFSRYARYYVGRHFHEVRLSRSGPLPPVDDTPLIMYSNHPSWWDPLMGTVLVSRFFSDRQHYAAIEAAALEQYRFFSKLGFFGVETGTRKGAKQFLTTAAALIDQPRATIWITPQGRFADPRERPVQFAAGLGHLAGRCQRGRFVPLAFEYPFWDERFPEALIRFGEPVDATAADCRRPEDFTALFSEKMTDNQNTLATEAIGRDPAVFETLLGGSAGVGGVYDLWRRGKALLQGRRFEAEHGAIDRSRPS